MPYPKPVLVLSACLAGDNVRYDGKPVLEPFSQELARHSEVIKVCPEVALGLGVPREKVIVYKNDSAVRLFQPAKGLELTEAMARFSEEFLNSLPEVDGFLLKSKSPSCGVSRTKVYGDPEGRLYRGTGKGLFALKVIERFPYLPVEDELRLRRRRLRLNFLVSLFSLAGVREKGHENFHREFGTVFRAYAPRVELRLRNSTSAGEYRKNLRKAILKLPPGALRELAKELVSPELLMKT